MYLFRFQFPFPNMALYQSQYCHTNVICVIYYFNIGIFDPNKFLSRCAFVPIDCISCRSIHNSSVTFLWWRRNVFHCDCTHATIYTINGITLGNAKVLKNQQNCKTIHHVSLSSSVCKTKTQQPARYDNTSGYN